MTAYRRYLQSHRAVELFAIILLGVAFSRWRRNSADLGFEHLNGTVPYPVIFLFPLVVSMATVAALRDPFGELEPTLSLHPWLWRALLVSTSLSLAVGLFSVGLYDQVKTVEFIVRNLIGMTGAGCLCALAIGPGLAWMPVTIAFMVMYLASANASFTSPSFPDVLWQWPLLFPFTFSSWIVALVLGTGIPLYCWKGSRAGRFWT